MLESLQDMDLLVSGGDWIRMVILKNDGLS
jgi:hypothetical protein